jgi:hypothetical protein
MFTFDVETLGVESSSVILSMACIHFEPESKPTYKELKDSAFFVKLNVRDQVENYSRKIDKGTIAWWEKQCLNARNWSYIPDKNDKPLAEGVAALHEWANSKNDKASWVWARGSLDDVILQAAERQVKVEPVFAYSRWRDVRTAVDLLTLSKNGYCEVGHPEFLYERDVTKHNPIDDCALDIMMLLYGKEKS